MASSTGTGWAQLRQQARSLETQVVNLHISDWMGCCELHNQTEALFHTYSQFASAANIPSKPTEAELRTEAQLQDILERVGYHNKQLYFRWSITDIVVIARSPCRTALTSARLRVRPHLLRAQTKQPFPTPRDPTGSPARVGTLTFQHCGCA